MDAVKIYFAKLKPEARIPQKREEDAGYDVYACLDGDFLRLAPHQTLMLPTGIASACPPEYFFRIAERGSTGSKGIGQRCGVIDSGYRGEWFVSITNHNAVPLYFIKPGCLDSLPAGIEPDAIIYSTEKAVCQALVLPVPKTEICELSAQELNAISSARSDGKLGSSGK